MPKRKDATQRKAPPRKRQPPARLRPEAPPTSSHEDDRPTHAGAAANESDSSLQALVATMAKQQANMQQQIKSLTDTVQALANTREPAQQQARSAVASTSSPDTGNPDTQDAGISASYASAPSTSGEFHQLPLTFGVPPSRPVVSGGLPIGSNVSPAMQKKIWEHKYVELADLLHCDSTGFTLSLTSIQDSPSLSLLPRKKKRLTEQEWAAAFDIFLAVYVQKYPEQLTAILSYAQNIKELAKAGANWAFYDSKYRQDREFSHCSWLTVRQDLELRAFRPAAQHPVQRTQSGPSNARVPKSFCFKYHTQGVRCENSNCSYKHHCPRCSRPHPAYARCNNNSGNESRPPSGPRPNKPANPNTSKPSK